MILSIERFLTITVIEKLTSFNEKIVLKRHDLDSTMVLSDQTERAGERTFAPRVFLFFGGRLKGKRTGSVSWKSDCRDRLQLFDKSV
jgi:hypothetical protein